MGTLTAPEYETLDSETLSDKTQAGGVKHNGSNSPETRSDPLGPQARSSEAREPAATMANDLLNQDIEAEAAVDPAGGCELDRAFGVPVEQKPLWVDLYESICDIFFPPKLPPLELTSTPIPVPDRMAVKRNPWAVGISTVLNSGVVALMLFLGIKTYIDKTKQPVVMTPIDLTDYKAPKAIVAAGGGGGSPDKIEAIKG